MVFEILHEHRLLKLTEATNLEIKQLKLSLTKQVEGWAYKKKKMRSNWDGKVTYMKNNMYIPLGLYQEVLKIGDAYGLPVHITNQKSILDNSLKKKDFEKWVDDFYEGNKNFKRKGIKPRPYQIEAAYEIIKHQNSINELATSAGKTLIAFTTIAYLLKEKNIKKILMIVPNVSLVEQGMNDFNEYNDDALDINIQPIYSGKKQIERSNIVIGTYQSLVKKDKKYFELFDAVIVDETHRANSNSIKNILANCIKTRYRFGMTGTLPKEGTLESFNLMSQLGPVITRVTAKDLIDQNYITPVEIRVLMLQHEDQAAKTALYELFTSGTDPKEILDLEKNYINNNERRFEILAKIVSSVNKNTLVLFHRIQYGKKLYDEVKNLKGFDVYYVDGGTPTDKREIYKKRMERQNTNTVNYTVFEFDSYQISIKSNSKVLLTSGEYKKAKDVTINDEIDDNFLNKFKKEPLL